VFSSSCDGRPFGHSRHGPKIGVCAPYGGKLDPHVHNVAWAEAYLRIKWHLDPSSRLATTDMGRKLRCSAPQGGGAGSTRNTTLPGPRPTFVPSGILIHPAVWPQLNISRKVGAMPLLGGAGSHLTQCGLGRSLLPYQVAS